MRALFAALLFAGAGLALNATASAEEVAPSPGHYSGPMDINTHSLARVGDGTGVHVSPQELDAPIPLPANAHLQRSYAPNVAGVPAGNQSWYHPGSGPYYNPYPPAPQPVYPVPPAYVSPAPYPVYHHPDYLPPAEYIPPPAPHFNSREYRRYLERTVPNYHDLPLGKRLRMEWEATGGWDNPRNYQPKR